MVGDMADTLTPQQILDADLADWRFLLQRLHARFTFDDYATGLSLVGAIGAYAQEADHHPDLDLRYGALRVITSSHDVGALTDRDVRLAREVSRLAAEHGVRAEPHTVQELEIALDTPDHERIRPFWEAVLGGESKVADEVTDPVTTVPALWFQKCDPLAEEDVANEQGRMRFHLDITVPHDVALSRVEAALAAGGTLVTAQYARSFWVLADADGNKACVCTWQDRG